MGKIRYGVVGCGHFGSEAARLIQESPNGEVIAVYSLTGEGAKRIAEELGCSVESSLDALIGRNDIDAVLVATPNHAHKEGVIKAAQAGKHVFCEKPFGLNLDEAREMVEACRQSGKVYMVGYMLRYYDGIIEMKRLLEEGKIGRPLVARMVRTSWDPPQPKEAGANVSWKKIQRLSGGHLFHHIHEVDLMYWMMGPASTVYAAGGNLAHDPAVDGDQDDVILITLQFENGSLGTVESGSAFQKREHYVKVNGTEGYLYLDFSTAHLSWMHDGITEQLPLFHDPEGQNAILDLYRNGLRHGKPTDRPPHYFRELFLKELRDFEAAIRLDPVSPYKEDMFDGTAALAGVAIADAAIESKEKSEAITFYLNKRT